ncbi:MAG TPA: hypothetical protein VLM42_14815 [Bryobacteraceae bacterium]|nr:hypothetical protein [Bryobacteraceae bacterium]
MRYLSVLLLLANCGLADTVMFHDGHQVSGAFLGGDSRTIRVAVGDHVETIPVIDINRIVFGDSGQALAPPVLRDRPSDRQDDRRFAQQAPPPPPPARREDFYDGPMIPSGTVLTIRMVDSVDSERDTVGQTFQASLDEPLFDPNGRTLVPRGSDVVVKLVDDEQSGKIEGRTVLTLDIVSLSVNGRVVNVDTTAITEQSGSRTARSGKVIGGTAILGAIIGGIAGGGKGAAIGLGAGAGAGTVAQVATKGQRVRIPSETRLTFTLQQPVRL